MSKTVIVSYGTYPDNKGGACLYNHYLQRMFPDIKIYGWNNVYTNTKYRNISEIEKASLLSGTLETRGLIKEGDTILGDGIWGNYGLPENKYNLISICHGPWSSVCSPNDPRIEKQRFGYIRSKRVIAVSPSAVQECKESYGVKAHKILTGLDTDYWKPIHEEGGNIIIWEAGKWNSLNTLREECQARLREFSHVEIRTFDDYEVRKLYNSGFVYVHLTKWEANSFAILKALSCDRPVVGTDTGLMWCKSIVEKNKLGIVASSPVQNVVLAVEKIRQLQDRFHPRDWILRNCTLEKFKEQWLPVLDQDEQ